MQRREFITLLGGAAAWPLVARAQGKIPRVGFMGNSTAALEANLVASFREGLRELGYEEGRNIAIDYRWADGQTSASRRWSPNSLPPRWMLSSPQARPRHLR